MEDDIFKIMVASDNHLGYKYCATHTNNHSVEKKIQ